MNRKEFIKKLRRELAKLPAEEREAAIEYYEEYFDEAGPEHEQELIGELGSPKRIAAQIKSDYAARLLDGEEPQPVKTGLSAVWWIIIGICSAPLSIPLAVTLVAAAITVFAVFISVVVSVFAAIIGVVAFAVASIVMGVMAIPAAFSSALLFIGGGAALLALMAAAGAGAVAGVRVVVRASARMVHRRSEKKRARRFMTEADAGSWKYRNSTDRSTSTFESDLQQHDAEEHEENRGVE